MAMTPEWPCPYCGHEDWTAPFRPGRGLARLTPAVCNHCHVLFNPHWVDGCWMGRMQESCWPHGADYGLAELGLVHLAPLADFVAMRAETLRGERP